MPQICSDTPTTSTDMEIASPISKKRRTANKSSSDMEITTPAKKSDNKSKKKKKSKKSIPKRKTPSRIVSSGLLAKAKERVAVLVEIPTRKTRAWHWDFVEISKSSIENFNCTICGKIFHRKASARDSDCRESNFVVAKNAE